MLRSTLYFGDNLDILRRYIPDETIDLIYLDPPFKSDQDYNILFREADGSRPAAQIQAFEDTWHWDRAAAASYDEVIRAGGRVAAALVAMRQLLGENDMLAYLSMMTPRLVELHRTLKRSGSIFLHCDPTASHYLKLLMDAVFGATQFKNEIIWRRTGSHNSSKRFGPIHDTLLFYAKGDTHYFRRTFRPYLKGHAESYFKNEDEHGRFWTNALTGADIRHGDSGRPWRNYDPTKVGRHWAIPGRIAEELAIDPQLTPQQKLDALDEAGFVCHPPEGSKAMPTYRQYLEDSPGMPVQDIWSYQPHTRGVLCDTDEAIDEDVRWLVRQGDKERLGYPTQKPLGLLQRIIEAACPPKGVVFDPFCGCGTAIAGAQQLGRPWIGIDVTHLAIGLIRHRLVDMFGVKIVKDFAVVGEPVDETGATELAKTDPFQFQWWALGLVGARPAEPKKGADQGIDGQLFFHDGGPGTPTRRVVLSVKGGKLALTHARDLRGVMEREKADIAALISLHEPSSAMRREAASAGLYASPMGTKHARLQLLTIAELLAGSRLDIPPWHEARTFSRATRAKPRKTDDDLLPFKKSKRTYRPEDDVALGAEDVD